MSQMLFLCSLQIVGLILAILESQQEVAAILIPPIMKLELSTLLIKLMAFEMSTLSEGRVPERYTFLRSPCFD